MQFFWTYFATVFLIFVGCFLILIVLLQRGRGGGLAGAFGGLGGQSAFGTKAGDVFTKITVVVAVLWVALAAGTSFVMRGEAEGRFKGGSEAAPEQPEVGAADKQDADATESQEEPGGPDEKQGPTTAPVQNTTEGNASGSEEDSTKSEQPE